MRVRVMSPCLQYYVTYDDRDLVLHPDVHDACAMLDAATNGVKTFIAGVGSRYDSHVTGVVYYVYDQWMQQGAT